MSEKEGSSAGPSNSYSTFSAILRPATSSSFSSEVSSFTTPGSSIFQPKGNAFTFGSNDNTASNNFGSTSADAALAAATSSHAGPSDVFRNGQEDTGKDNENALGGSKISDDARKKRFEDLPKQNRFFEMKKQRDALRLKYIAQGVLPDPDRAQDLSAAKSLKGICMEMCPEFEREEREFQNEGDILEMFPGTSRIDPELAVKIYRRPAAGRELPLPEDVRPPTVLRQTLDYLFHKLLPPDPASAQFTAVQPFMWNRTRAIRQDFIVQGLRGDLEIECHERIARYHILCLHWKGGLGADGWSEQQELEQLRKTIRSLTEFYEDYRRSTGKSSKNEAEFRAYNLLLHMQDPETLREVEGLPIEVFDAPAIQAALKLRGYAQRSNNVVRRGRPLNTEATMNLWTRYFGEIRRSKDVTYLLACLAENTFSQVRAGAIKAMSKTYLERHAPLSLDFLKRVLGMDTEEEARQFAVALNCEEVRSEGVQSAIIGLRLAKANEDKPLPSVNFSQSVVEVKRDGATVQDIVDGKTSNAAPLVQISQAAMPQSTPALASIANSRPSLPSLFNLKQPSSQTFLPSIATIASSSTTTSTLTHTSHPPILDVKSLPFQATSSEGPNVSSRLSPSAPVFTPLSTKSSPTAAPSKESSFYSASEDQPKESIQSYTPSTRPALPLPSFGPGPTNHTSFAFPDQKEINVSTTGDKYNAEVSKASLEKRNDQVSSSISDVKNDIMPATSTVIIETTPKRPKRTIASVASSLTEFLINDFVDQRIANISHQACLRELRQRKEVARRDVIDENVTILYEMLEREVMDDYLAQILSEAIADEFRIRSLEQMVLRGRKKALVKATEKRRQAERYEEIRQKLDQRGVRDSNLKVHSRNGLAESYEVLGRNHIEAAKDAEIKSALQSATESRNMLWMQGTFVDAIASHLNKTSTVKGLKNWSVGLATHQPGQTSSDWLETKMSLHETSHLTVEIKGAITLHLYNLALKGKLLEQEMDSIGLVMFELAYTPKSDDVDEKDSWAHDRNRLEEISQRYFITHSRYLPKLMILCWSRESCQDKKQILKQLHLGATDEQRFHWSQVDICCLDNTLQSPQVSFEASLSILLDDFPLNQRQHRLSLEGIAEMSKVPWIQLLNHLQGATGFLSTDDAFQLAQRAFKAVTILGSKVLTLILTTSGTILEESEYPAYASIPLSNQEDASKTLYTLAFEQLKRCEEEEENSKIFSLLKLWLLQESQLHHSVFPWSAYFEQLFQCHVSRLQEVWLDCKLPLSKANISKMDSVSNLCEKAWIEIEWRMNEVKANPIDVESVAKKTKKKKRSIQEVDEKEVVISKTRRVQDDVHTSIDSIQSTSITNLRALMTSAAKILNDTSTL